MASSLLIVDARFGATSGAQTCLLMSARRADARLEQLHVALIPIVAQAPLGNSRDEQLKFLGSFQGQRPVSAQATTSNEQC